MTIDGTHHDATVKGVLTFTGTYAPFSIGEGGDNTVLYLGEANTLYYPTDVMTIGCQRAYFQLLDGLTAGEPSSPNAVRVFVLNFGDEATFLNEELRMKNEESAGAWYTLDGRRLSGKPTKSGVYIKGGRKVLVK